MAHTKPRSAPVAQRSGKRTAPPASGHAARLASGQAGPAISATEALNLALQVSRSIHVTLGQRAKKTTKAIKVKPGLMRSGQIKAVAPGRAADALMFAKTHQGKVHSPGKAKGSDHLGEFGSLMQRLKAQLLDVGILSTAKVRLRPADEPERRVHVEFYPDPAEEGAVFLRLSPARPEEGIEEPMVAGASVEQLVSPQEVAEMLGVSRPYAAKLCDSRVFGHVEVSQGGHRKVALSRVRAYIAEREAMATALDEMAELTRGAQAQDAAKAAGLRKASGKVWVKTRASDTK